MNSRQFLSRLERGLPAGVTGARGRCASFLGYRALVETLEPRQLLSGYVLDTSFGNGGVMANVEASSIRADGSIIADSGGKSFLLNSDGTPGVLSASLAPPAVPTPPQPTNKQADGKYLTVTTVTHSDHTESGTLTRYNKNGAIDATFGKNGSLTDFSFVGDATFAPEQVIVVGTKIYVIGSVHSDYSSQWFGLVKVQRWALVALKPNGSLDPAFKPMLQPAEIGTGDYSSATFAGLGADGTLYLTGESDIPNDEDDPYMGFYAISPSGKRIASQFNGDQGFGIVVDGPAYTPTGLAVFLVGTIENSVVGIYGPYGSAGVSIPIAIKGDLNTPFENGWALVGADNRIFVSYKTQESPDTYLLCYRPVVDNTGSVSGHFFNDVNGNGKLDKTEGGLASWQVYADLNNNGVFDLGEPTAYTDLLGNYTIGNLTPGTYHIREVRKTGWNRTSPAGDWPTGGVYTVTVAAIKTVTNLNFGNTDTKHGVGSISGTIFNDLNGTGIRDAGEPGLAGWQVYADFNNNGVYDAGEPAATTDRNGNYKFTNLPQGGFRIREVRQSGWLRTSPSGDWPLGYYDSDIVTGQNVTGDIFGNARGDSIYAAISGTVFNDLNGNGKLDPGEKPAAGVTVSLIDYKDYDTIGAMTTKADGSYSFTQIDPRDFVNGGYFDISTGVAPPLQLISKIDIASLIRPSQTIRVNLFVQYLARFGVAIYNDVNGNAKIDPNDGPGSSGLVYIDLNNNGQLDAGEPTISTGYDQQLSNWITPGKYYLRLIPTSGWIATYPSANNPLVITLLPGQTLNGLIFTVHEVPPNSH